jgi:hypothetical protein
VVDNLVAAFERELRAIVAKARNETVSTVSSRLSIVDGVVSHTKTNQKVLQSVESIFQRAMKRNGYDVLVKEYVKSFNGQFQFFQDTLDTLGKEIGKDLQVNFGANDKHAFLQQQVSAVQNLDSIVDQTAANAERQAMLSVGGIKLDTLVQALAVKMDDTVGRATTIADTSLSMFYRTIAKRGYDIVQKGLKKGWVMRFTYAGPDDALVRPFCEDRLNETNKGRSWTMEEIMAMDNDQLPNAFLTCGGYNCRHQWLLQPLEGPEESQTEKVVAA